ncbi:MAG: hypothetical protein M3P46_06980, partial [Actinomycetota bacterium]|nr:hypothetical protein [Actinomycetota bacterium]
MRWYAETGAVRLRQQLLDVGVLVWCFVFLRLADAVQAAVLRLQEPGRQLQDAGGGLARALDDAAQRVADAPLVGDRLRA